MAARKRISAAIRRKIWQRDGFKCRYCGNEISENAGSHNRVWHCASIDHVVPVRDGGSDDEANLVSACLFCNLSKKAKSVSEFRPLHPVPI
jgi:5-methylcytosine-specific restriction endonuclease McrA